MHSTHASTQLTRYISRDFTAYWITFVVAIPEVLQRPCPTTTHGHTLCHALQGRFRFFTSRLISSKFICHVTATPQPTLRPTLGEIVENGCWNSLLGDWVDVVTRGEFRLSLNWKIKNQLLELTTIDQNGQSISAISVDPESHQVVHVGTNCEGTTTSGKWVFASPKGPKLAARFAVVGGVQGELNMQLVAQSEDAMVLSVGAQQMANVQLMRTPQNTR